MRILGFLAVGGGAASGAWLRWGLGILLNGLFPTLPLGTLAVARLLVTTGFLGGLTTFSTFSAEAATLVSRQQLAWAAGHIAVHVAGSIAMTFVGIVFMRVLLR